MSDPGVTYRTRDEIQNVRQTRDSVNYIGHILMENGIMDEKQWKEFQNSIKKEVKGWVNDCLKTTLQFSAPPLPEINDLPSFLLIPAEREGGEKC